MSDPLSRITEAVGVGVASAFTLEMLGLPIQPIVWAFVGGFIGTGWAKPATILVRIGTYVSASLLSALGGSAFAGHFWPDSQLMGNTCSALLSVCFHPALSAAVQRIPILFDTLLSAFSKKEIP